MAAELKALRLFHVKNENIIDLYEIIDYISFKRKDKYFDFRSYWRCDLKIMKRRHNTMNSRERVMTALGHAEPDRVPLDFGSGKSCRFTVGAYKKITGYLGLPEKPLRLSSKVSQLVVPDDELSERLKTDVRTPHNCMIDAPGEDWETDTDYFYRDCWGVEYRMAKKGGLYYDMVKFPYADRLDEPYIWPEMSRPNPKALDEARAYHAAGYPVFCGEAYTNGFLQTGPRIYGFNNWLTMLAVDEEAVEAFLDSLLEQKLKYYDLLFGMFGDSIDIVNEGDDLGTQNGLFISPEMYRRLIKPRQSKLYHYIKDKYHVKVFLHSCGAVSDIIPDLIEAGVDILNPIQISAKGMDVFRLKRDFGKDIVFWGGTIDSQNMLPHGTPQEIKDEVKRRIDQLAPGGGFVFAPIHNFQPDVPVENIMAMWEAFQDNCRYR